MKLYTFNKNNANDVLILVSVTLVLIIWTFINFRLDEDKGLMLNQPISNLKNIAISFKEHSQTTIRNSDEALRIVKFHYEQKGASDFKLLNEYFDQNVIDVNFFNQVGIINAEGVYEFSNLKTHKKVDLSDREHFKIHKDIYPYGLYLSKPVLGRVSQKWSIQLTKRLNKPNGDLLGVAVVSFDPNYFIDFHKKIDLGPEGFTSLVGADGFVRTLRVGNISKIDGSVPKISLPPIVGQMTSGTFVSDDLFDHSKRIYAFEKIPDQPLYVIVGMLEKDAMFEYDRLKKSYLIFGFLISMLIIIFTLSALSMLNKARRLNLELLSSSHEKERAQEHELEMSTRLTQSEKMAALGQLAAGVAHEINNPIAFVSSNLSTLKKYFEIFNQIIEGFSSDLHLKFEGSSQLLKSSNYEFLKTDVVSILSESQEGIVRVKNIVNDLKNFSRLEESTDWILADVHKGIQSTLNIVNFEVKYHAEVECLFGDLPEISCIPSQLNQVFLNLIVNAAQAIPDGQFGKILIQTGIMGDSIWIEISDNGVGVSDETMIKMFEPFYTTKKVGVGTGLGLSVSLGIVEKHMGSLTAKSTLGQGTTFRIELPIAQNHQIKPPTDLATST
jgi:signal transduction histidine kinase